MTLDPYGAFVRLVPERAGQDPGGPLGGLTFAVKDNVDVRGHPTGNGHPGYARWRGTPERDAAVVTILETAGARCVAKTHMHELAYGLTGVNRSLGTPTNPNRPGRIPGGSSSGSAVATAAGLVDFAIGTDTGGSVRVPAAFCGVHGYRPTHGKISVGGVVSLAESFDTVGVFARTAERLARVAATLRPGSLGRGSRAQSVVVFTDIDDLVDEVARRRLDELASDLERLGYRIKAHEGRRLLEHARAAQTVLQGVEAFRYHAEWIETEAPELGRDVEALLMAGKGRSDREVREALRLGREVKDELESLLGERSVLLLPACPGDPPAVEDLSDPQASLRFRTSVLNLSNLASLTGSPVVSVPTPRPRGEGVGVQLVGRPAEDWLVLDMAVELERARGRA